MKLATTEHPISATMRSIRWMLEKHMPKGNEGLEPLKGGKDRIIRFQPKLTEAQERELAAMYDSGIIPEDIRKATSRSYAVIRRSIIKYATKPLRTKTEIRQDAARRSKARRAAATPPVQL